MNNETPMLSPEQFLQVPPTLACAIGLNEAIVLQHLHWLLMNPKNGKEIDGDRWIFNTYQSWRETYFPFWSEDTIKRTFQRLEEQSIVVSCQPEGGISRRKYYRISRGALQNLTVERFRQGKLLSPSGQSAPMVDASCTVPITETTTETTYRDRVSKDTRLIRKRTTRFPYPESRDEMEQTLLNHGIDPNPDYDGSFFEQMDRSNWTINGERVWDWIATYQARLDLTNPS